MNPNPIRWPDRMPTIPERLGQIVQRVPDRVAVTAGDREVTFAELDDLSGALARQLVSIGDRGGAAGILADHGIDVVVAMVAAVRAGRPFTVIDPATPAARMLQVIDDFGADALITSPGRQRLADELAMGTGDVVVVGDGPAANGATLPSTTHPVAGVFYTSGSTGDPKGVMRAQEGIVRRVRYEQELADLGPGDVVSLLYSCSYGASQNDLWTSLLSGARLALYPVAAEGVTRLADWIESESVTWLHLPIALLRQLLDITEPGRHCEQLRFVLPSGRFFGSDVEAIRRNLSPTARIYSQFASTETSIAARYVIEPDQGLAPDAVAPVGREVPGVYVSVVDEDGTEASPGVEGRFLVSSPMLSPGYWSRPEETREVFDRDPARPSLRRFSSGDYGWRDVDGILHFVGRRDDRVKVRGYRVELNEVANQLRQVPGIRDAHARLEDRRGERLVGYVVPTPGTTFDPDRTRRELSTRVAGHKIPSIFIELDALPLTANGKLDTSKLPSAEIGHVVGSADFVAPTTETEHIVADIWQEALGLDRVGIATRFADLGGDSLAAMRVVARVVRRCEVEVPLRELLEQGTVASMAELVDAAQASADRPISRASGTRHPLSHQQQNVWISEQLLRNGELNTVRAVDLTGPLDADAMGRAVDRLVGRHDMLRVVFPFDGSEPVQQVLEPASGLLSVHHDGSEPTVAAAEIDRRINEHLDTPIDLSTGPCFGAELHVVGPDKATLLLTGHHVCSDRTSSSIMLDDLAALYRHEIGAGPPPEPSPVRYVDYATWQRNRLPDDVVDIAAGRWSERLSPAPPAPAPLIRDHRFPGAGPVTVSVWRAEAPTGELISRLATQERTTAFTVVMACLKAALHRVTGIDDLVVTTVLSGRDRPELESLVGLLVNQLPIRSSAPPVPTLRRWVQVEREATLGAFDDRDVPFGAIVARLNPPRRAGRVPFADVTLNFTAPRTGVHDFGTLQGRRRRTRAAGEVTFAVRAQLVDGALGGDVSVDPTWVDPDVADKVIAELVRIAQEGAARPDRRWDPSPESPRS